MKNILIILSILGVINTAYCFEYDEDETKAYNVYEQMSEILDGDWVLSIESKQEGTTSYKNPAISFLVGSDAAGIGYKQIGKGSTLQEDLLPNTQKQMVTMYFCDTYLKCKNLKLLIIVQNKIILNLY